MSISTETASQVSLYHRSGAKRFPDLVLHCERPQSSSRFIQIWINNGRQGYVLARSYDLPEGSGALSFADMGELARTRTGDLT